MQPALKNLSLSKKFVIPMSLVVTLVLVVMAAWLLQSIHRSIVVLEMQGRDALLAEKAAIADTVEDSLKAKADILGRFMAKIAPDFILSYDYTSLESFIEIAAKDSDVTRVLFLNPQGATMAGNARQESLGRQRTYQFPIQNDGEPLGSVQVNLSEENLDTTLRASEGRINETIQHFKKEAAGIKTAVSRLVVAGIVAVVLALSAVQFLLFRRVVNVPLRQTHDRLRDIAHGDGDLTKRVPISSRDEIGQVGGAVNLFIHTLQKMISQVQGNADAVMTESLDLTRLSEGMSESAKTQVDKTLNIRDGMDQIANTIMEISGNTSNVVNYAEQVDQKATQGASIVQESVEKMHRIASSVESIGETIEILRRSSEEVQGVVDAIDEIANQTNLLSLNAAIESARAGEHGRGFSVVAAEVGKLAERTGKATQEIGDLIRRIQAEIREAVASTTEGRENVRSGVVAIQDAGLALDHIKSSVSTLSEKIQEIAVATEEHSVASEMANTYVAEIAQEAEGINQHARDSLSLGKRVSKLSAELNDLVCRFRCLDRDSAALRE